MTILLHTKIVFLLTPYLKKGWAYKPVSYLLLNCKANHLLTAVT